MEKADMVTIEQRPIRWKQHSHYEPTTNEERELDRTINLKLDLVVVLILSINFILCGIDKTNIGFVATTNFVKDANLRPDDVPDSVSLLSVTFVTLQPFSAAIGRYIRPKYWICLMMLFWGAVCMAHAGVKNRATLIALRLLLGAAEAGFVPTSFYYLSTLYPKYVLGRRLGLFCGMFAIAGAFAGLIAYGLFKIKSDVLHDWQILFIFEGAITLLMAIVTFVMLPADLHTAWFLTPLQRAHAVRRMQMDLDENVPDIEEVATTKESRRFSSRDLKEALTDWKKLIVILFNITATLPVSAFSYFMPLLVKGMGYTGVKASLMSVPPFIVGAIGLFCFVTSSDYFKERSLHVMSAMFLAIIGLIVMVVSTSSKLRYGFTHVCLAGAFTGGPLIVAWIAGNTPEKGVRSILIGINGYSNLAGVIAGQLFKTKHSPRYRFPLTVTMCIMSAGIVGFGIIRSVFVYINRSRERKIATWTDADFETEENSTVRRGDRRYTFKYGY
ncbi:MFS general substrate transporter [Eremomyces bilateralis CBS 781.70]|uniref:MFS general substrate transporter n=1 Tax=Eremomyces bilateralis CBS 781.70 TaxID=1392243 RepID=A0A6G1G856_9PEZI|nr:MFS general substrate transporter [Eremomyces bilateralis CBS 781.70]KAF1814247.1 MFS general substrate transporter [Eremomyces bilateralis CBS 781.70]